MQVMKEESFGPVIGIMKVKNDEEAIAIDAGYRIWTNCISLQQQIRKEQKIFYSR